MILRQPTHPLSFRHPRIEPFFLRITVQLKDTTCDSFVQLLRQLLSRDFTVSRVLLAFQPPSTRPFSNRCERNKAKFFQYGTSAPSPPLLEPQPRAPSMEHSFTNSSLRPGYREVNSRSELYNRGEIE